MEKHDERDFKNNSSRMEFETRNYRWSRWGSVLNFKIEL